MTQTLNRLSLSILSLAVMGTAGFGQARTGTRHQITGTWSGIFALKNPNGTVSHNRVVVKLKVRGANVIGSIGSSIDNQSDTLAGQVVGEVIAFRVSAGRLTEFRLHLSNGHLYGHAFGVGENQSERAAPTCNPPRSCCPTTTS